MPKKLIHAEYKEAKLKKVLGRIEKNATPKLRDLAKAARVEKAEAN